MRKSMIFLALAIACGIVTAAALYRSDWMPNYETQTAAQKMSYLWGKVTADTSSAAGAGVWLIGKTTLPTWLGGMDFTLIGGTVSDQIPDGILKGIHTVGHVARGKMVWNANSTKLGLTGSFKVGHAENVIARFSNAVSTSRKIVPNVAFKYLRTGVASGNGFGSHAISPQKSQNWFDWGACNNVPTLEKGLSADGIENMLLEQVFKKAGEGNIATTTGVSEIANYDQNGQHEGKVVSPYTVCYQPTKAIRDRNANAKVEGELFGKMSDIPSGTVLYEVYAIMNPKKPSDVQQSDVTHIGHFELTASPTPSKFGDEQLFFKHTYWQRELDVSGKRKEWSFINPDFLVGEGITKYEKFFKKEHQINVGRTEKRRLRRRMNIKY